MIYYILGSVIVVLILCGVITIIALVNKKNKKEAVKWAESYNNLLDLHNKNMEVMSRYEEKADNIKPTAGSYNDIVSDWTSNSESEDSK